jgi:hypothetical protein
MMKSHGHRDATMILVAYRHGRSQMIRKMRGVIIVALISI